MTSALQNRFFASAWACSLTLHGVIAGLALLFAAQMKPVLEEDVFSWEVALVQEARIEPAPLPPAPAVKPAPPARQITPPQPVEPPSDMVMTPVAPRRSVEMVHPVVEPPKPVERKIEPPIQRIEPVERKMEPPQPKSEPIEQKVVEVEKPRIEPVQEKVAVAGQPKIAPVQQVVEAKTAAPAVTAEPIVPHAPVVAMTAPAEPVPNPSLAANTYVPPKHSSSSSEAVTENNETPSLEDLAPIRRSLVPIGETSASAAVKPSAAPSVGSTDEPGVVAAASSGAAESVPSLTAKAPVPNQETKEDHKWLAESLWRRVAEVKRYPTSARMNGLEGKVVLKAVIRSDGQLAEVTVQKSSGHNVLDAAAIEAVKLACPLHMKQELGKPQIVVSLPIVYSLAN